MVPLLCGANLRDNSASRDEGRHCPWEPPSLRRHLTATLRGVPTRHFSSSRSAVPTSRRLCIEALRVRTRTAGRAWRDHYQQRLRCVRIARRGRGVLRGGRPDEFRLALLGAVRIMRVGAEELLRATFARCMPNLQS